VKARHHAAARTFLDSWIEWPLPAVLWQMEAAAPLHRIRHVAALAERETSPATLAFSVVDRSPV
jgi:hypothetical protein